jgi:SAM-dependent methyltransferase
VVTTSNEARRLSLLTPTRRRGTEFLDDPRIDPAIRRRSQADVARSNRILGGLRAVVSELAEVFRETRGDVTLLDVGTGVGDIPAHAVTLARQSGVRLSVTGVDVAHTLLATECGDLTHGVCADARRLPFPDRAFDIVICSQLLHHFAEPELRDVIAELDRVARRVIVVSDLRRSWFAAAGFWTASVPLRLHHVTRHDGFVSVLRGFTTAELAEIVETITGARPRVRRRLGYRITARWVPNTTRGPMDEPHDLGTMPNDRRMTTVDERLVRAPLPAIFALARDVERWPRVLRHYRYVRFRSRTRDTGGLVEMSANRPFGPIGWPTYWTSLMAVRESENGNGPEIRFRHVAGVTTGMDVAWTFEAAGDATRVRIVHVWNGPRWPVIGAIAARAVIGPVFVHGIASRTLAGLAAEAERMQASTHS